MSVDQIDIVDAIGTHPDSGDVELTIMDHLPWDRNHLDLLNRKLSAYARFVESGQLLESYPIAAGASVRFLLLLKHRPDELGAKFLELARATARERGISLEYKPIPHLGYSDDSA